MEKLIVNMHLIKKTLIIDSFQSQNSRQELEINSPYDKVCEQ